MGIRRNAAIICTSKLIKGTDFRLGDDIDDDDDDDDADDDDDGLRSI
jgi:hypothetical protein